MRDKLRGFGIAGAVGGPGDDVELLVRFLEALDHRVDVATIKGIRGVAHVLIDKRELLLPDLLPLGLSLLGRFALCLRPLVPADGDQRRDHEHNNDPDARAGSSVGTSPA